MTPESNKHYDILGRIYRKQPGDANSYTTGRIGQHNIVLCYIQASLGEFHCPYEQ